MDPAVHISLSVYPLQDTPFSTSLSVYLLQHIPKQRLLSTTSLLVDASAPPDSTCQ